MPQSNEQQQRKRAAAAAARRQSAAAPRFRRAASRPPAEPAKVRSILAAALKRYGLDQELARYEFVLHWQEIVGADIARRAQPVSIKDGKLFVRVVSSVWAQELAFRAPVILQRLQKFLGKNEVVRDIHFFIGEMPGSVSRSLKGGARKYSY